MNNEWLSNLKVGDKVFLRETYWGIYSYKEVGYVDHILSTGEVCVNGIKFKKGKTSFNSDNPLEFYAYIEECTEQDYVEYMQQRYAEHIEARLQNLSEPLTYEQAQAIARIMGWGNQ